MWHHSRICQHFLKNLTACSLFSNLLEFWPTDLLLDIVRWPKKKTKWWYCWMPKLSHPFHCHNHESTWFLGGNYFSKGVQFECSKCMPMYGERKGLSEWFFANFNSEFVNFNSKFRRTDVFKDPFIFRFSRFWTV